MASPCIATSPWKDYLIMDEHTPRWRVGPRPLALPSQGSRGASYDAAVERAEAAFAAVRKALADRPVLDTVGDLAAVVAQLPPEVPLVVDDQVRIDRELASAGNDAVFVVVAELATVVSQPQLPVRDNDGREHDVVEPALQLGTRVLPSPGAPAPAETRPYYLPGRADDALDRGEVGEYLSLLGQQLTHMAGDVIGGVSEWVPGGVTPELVSLAEQLRHLGGRLSAYAPTAEALINDDQDGTTDDPEDSAGSPAS